MFWQRRVNRSNGADDEGRATEQGTRISEGGRMQIGMIGLGRMGGNIVRRLIKSGHRAVVYDKDAKAVTALSSEGAFGAGTLAGFVQQLEKPRAVWIMLPAGKITEDTIGEL